MSFRRQPGLQTENLDEIVTVSAPAGRTARKFPCALTKLARVSLSSNVQQREKTTGNTIAEFAPLPVSRKILFLRTAIDGSTPPATAPNPSWS